MLIVAHRGLHRRVPENSLAAVRAAIEAGLDRIEVDVRATADGQLVLLHDQTLSRTTTGRGALRRTRAQELADVRLADGTAVPSLRDVLDLARGHAVLCLDVKEPTIARDVIAEAAAAEAEVELWSTHREAVAAAADAGVCASWISLGLFSPDAVDALAEEAHQLGAHAVSFFPADLSPRTVTACRRLGLEVMSGTPNDRGTWEYMRQLGAQTIITDRPIECRAWLTTLPPQPQPR